MYILSYTLTHGLFLPLQKIFLPASLDVIGLLFLPHGVRALAFMFFGLRAVLYLLPVMYFCWGLAVWGSGILLDPIAPLYSLAACAFGYVLFILIKKLLATNTDKFSWHFLVLLGTVMALFNSIALASLLTFDQFIISAILYFFGDVMGLLVFLVLVMFVFRYIRNLNKIYDAYRDP